MRIQNTADSVSRWCVLLIAGLLPFFVVPVVWVGVAQAKFILIALLALTALLSWLFARFIEGFVRIPRKAILFAGALLPIAYGISAFVTGGAWTSLVGTSVAQDTVVVVTVWFALMAIVAFVSTRRPRSLLHILRAFLVGSLILVTFQVLRLAFPAVLSLGGFLSGNSSNIFGTWHDLGILAGVLFFMAFSLWKTPVVSALYWKAVLALLGLGSIALLIIINAADVWYALAGLFLIFFIYHVFGYWRAGFSLGRVLTRSILWIALAILMGVAGYWGQQYYSRLPASLQIAQPEVRPSWQGTYLIGQKVFSNPKTFIVGSGPNTFTRSWNLFKPTGVNQTDFWNIDFNSGVGFIPTTFVTTGVALFWGIVRFVWGKSEQSTRTTLATMLGVSAYIAAFQIMYIPGVALSALLFLFLGMVVALQLAEENQSIVLGLRALGGAGIARIIALVVVVGLVSFAPITALRATASDLLIQRAGSVYTASKDLQQALKMVQQAVSVFPQNDVAQRAAVEIGLLQIAELVNSKTGDEATKKQQLQAELERTISHGLSAISIDATNYQNWLELAFLYQNLVGAGIEGAYDNAKEAYERAILQNPTNPLPQVRIAQLAIGRGDLSVALQHLSKAIALKPNLGAAYFLRSQIEAQQGTFPQGIEDAVIAARLATEDALAWYNLGAILYSAGSYDLAAQALEKAVSLQNNYANAIFILGLSYDKLGRDDSALAAIGAVAQLNPSDATVQQVLTNLKAGKSALEAPTPSKNVPQKTTK